MNEIHQQTSSTGSAKIVYILYLVGTLVGITSLIGVIMAYVKQGEAPDWLKTHYCFQIRTFWISILYFSVGILLTFLLIGYAILLFNLVWLIIRAIKGISILGDNKPHPNPTTWLF